MRRAVVLALLLEMGVASSVHAAEVPAAVAPAADAATLARGQAVFEQRCGVCHRAGQTGTQMLARRLGKDKSLLAERTDLTVPYIQHVVRWGLVNMPRLTRVEMPDGDLDAIAAWLTRPRAP